MLYMQRTIKAALILLMTTALLPVVTSATDGGSAAPCLACHADTAAAFRATPHALNLPADAANSTTETRCAACHGDGMRHMANPAAPGLIIKFADAEPATVNSRCQTCHADTHSPGPDAHSRAGLACTSCHTVHDKTANDAARHSQNRPGFKTSVMPASLATIDAGSATCFACHQESFTQFQFNERHRLVEGSMTCADCHDPHAPGGDARLGAFRDAACTECHVDAGGPFMFEHAASKTDGCIACHAPHGSPNRHLLTHQQTGELCYSCHVVVPQFHLGFSPVGGPRFDERTQCTNCHVTIHGSNLDRNLLR
jgi:DmsE family decaheme c-type cytochrome